MTKFKQIRNCAATFIKCAAPAVVLLLINPHNTRAADFSQPDTSKKVYNIVTFGSLDTADSSIYMLNGKKISKAEFDKVDTKDIINVSWVSAENAAKVLNNFTGGASVLFVTTKGSDEGKKILAKINKLPDSHPHIARAGKGGVYTGSSNKTAAVLNLDSTGDYTVVGLESGMAIAKGNSPVITVKGRQSNANNSIVNGRDKAYLLVEGQGRNEFVTLAGGQPVTGPAINHLNEKLIIIDDKEATTNDLKKLSAFDIEKINFKNDDYTRQQYGDKAKKGVVYIYTKKTKK